MVRKVPGLPCLLAIAIAGCAPPTRIRVDTTDEFDDLRSGGVKDLAAGGPCGACAAPTPLCDVKTRKCVGCLSDSDCPLDAICMLSTCMPGCSARHSECGDAGSCDTDMALCHGCLRNRDCADPKLPHCDLETGRCAACDPKDDRCPQGTWCGPERGTVACIPGCKADIECQVADGGGASWACCAHTCADTMASAKNCGGCGTDCNGAACCMGACANTQNDVKNCGGCRKACPALNAIPQCANGMCGIAGCANGFADCNNQPNDGCETNVGGDVVHCGGCNRMCALPNSNPLCINGMCLNGGCKPGFRDCDGMAANGCEVNVQQDARNCGVCGQNCAQLPHASAGCSNGACVVAGCDPGWGNCNGKDNDGCETSLANDPANCGRCAQACPAPANVMTTCNNGVCASMGCLPGFGDCNNNMGDGCEAKFGSDPKNCGSCGANCGGYPNAVPGCVNGMCAVGACNAGFADCDKNIPNGCEVNINTDAANCGACAKACVQGQSCVAGMCSNPYPAACTQDKDVSGSNYIICAMNKTGAWITANNNGAGCTYAALNICKKYGFTRVGRWGGTCGTICGYCGAWTCQNPQGQFVLGAAFTNFDGGGGNPVGGGNISCTVHWECAP